MPERDRNETADKADRDEVTGSADDEFDPVDQDADEDDEDEDEEGVDESETGSDIRSDAGADAVGSPSERRDDDSIDRTSER